MKILFLHQHFKTPQTGGAIRSYYLAKALIDKGHQVVMITGHTGQYKKEEIEGIEVHWLPVPYDNRFGFYKRGQAFLKYIFKSVQLAKTFRDVDYCYAISVPLTIGLAAIRIKQKYRIPFYFEVGDLWPDAPIQLGFIKNFFLKRGLYGLEKIIYRQAKAIVALSPAIQSAIEKKVPGKKIFMIPNMADTDFFQPARKDGALENKFQVEKKFVVSYIGALGWANGLDYFLECARASQKANLPVQFLLCGDGAMLDYLNDIRQKLKLENFSLMPFQNREGVKEILNVTDATFICYKPVAILETGSPNKFFDGLAAGKLIITNFGGWIKEEVEENQCGVVLNPNQPSEFVKKILPYVEDAGVLHSAQQRARVLAEQKYSRRKLSEEFLRVLSVR